METMNIKSISKRLFRNNTMKRYEPLAAEEQSGESVLKKEISFDPIPENHGGTFLQLRSLRIILILTTAMALAFVVVLLSRFTLIRRQETSNPPYPSLQQAQVRSQFLDAGKWNYSNPSPCGLSRESAQKAGCLWSAMTFAWYPPACYDKEVEDEFLGVSDWQWYASDNLSAENTLPVGAVLRGDIRKAYMSMTFHKMHCLYSFKKLYRAMLGLALSDNYVLRSGHMEHCQHFMVAENAPAVTGVAKYLDCVVL